MEVEALGLAILTADRMPESDLDKAIRIKAYVKMREGVKRSEAIKEVTRMYGESRNWVWMHLRVAEDPGIERVF